MPIKTGFNYFFRTATDKEKYRVIKKAIQKANKEQRELMDINKEIELFREKFVKRSVFGVAILVGGSGEKQVIDFLKASLKRNRLEIIEEAIERVNLLKKIHIMELNALSCKSIEDFVKWQDFRKTQTHKIIKEMKEREK